MFLRGGNSFKAKWDRNKVQGQGVYIWEDGARARITFDPDENPVFGNRIIFPENDFRLEYRGDLKDGHIMNGHGTLTLKDGKTTYHGEWVNGVSKLFDSEIKAVE